METFLGTNGLNPNHANDSGALLEPSNFSYLGFQRNCAGAGLPGRSLKIRAPIRLEPLLNKLILITNVSGVASVAG